MKAMKLFQTTALATLLVPLGFGPAAADLIYGGNDVVRLSGHSDVYIEANNDDGGTNENVYVTVAGQTQMTITETRTTINDGLAVTGDVGVQGVLYDTNGDFVTVNEGLIVNGATTVSTGGLTVTGATDLNTGLNVDGTTTLDATTIAGTTSITGTTTVTGTTSINTSGGGNTSIGVAGNSTSIQSTNVVVGNATTSSSISVGTGSAANTITMGNGASATAVTASAGSSVMSLADGMTSINTTSGAATNIGVAGNSTSVLSSTVNVGTGAYATQVAIGSDQSGTDVFIGGGEAAGDIVAISSGATRALETQVVSDGNGNVTNEVDIRAKLVGVWDPVANPGGAELADITLDADDDVNIRTGDDLEVDAQSKIQLDAVDNIELDTGNNVDVIAANDIDMTATRILGTTGNAASVMQNGSIVNTVTASAGVSAETVVANNGSTRWVADANGKLTEVAGSDTTSGTTAAMVVTNSAGNTHGVVVQETKTTLSGGTNSSSLTLDERGATFSDSATGYPIQVHGVADGTAPFDAVNVRQLYSGLASVLAAAPDLRLEPGKSGFGIGLGSYGGYQAIGVGFGHMYDNGLVLTGSISRGEYSETAARASLSWNW